MYLSNDDMMELKRLAANTYEQEKSSQIYRIINAINKLESEAAGLRAEVKKLKSEVEKLKTEAESKAKS
jgi:polyhydroxyalkanoate synthesis regulator phasin